MARSKSPFSKSFEIEFRALAAAYVRHEAFTVQAFCARYGFRPNRHTRRILNGFAEDGLLTKHKTLFADGKYRMVYAAQLTKPLPGFSS